MKKRTLGSNGYKISEVGLGCWQFGGEWGDLPEERAFEIMRTAVENGVTFFDTADVYGGGRSEKLIGKFLNETDAEIRVATKFGRNPDIYPDNYTEAGLRKNVEGSLERLGVESLDLLQLHCIPQKELEKGEVFDWLRKIKEEGLIKAFGASVETVEEGLICIKQEGLLSLQVIFNIFRQKLVTELLPQAESNGVGIIARLPLASGLLSGKFSKDTTFPENDQRNFNSDGQLFNVGETFAGLPFEKGVELADQIKPLVPEDMTMAQMAQRWILDHDAVSVIIPGASKAEQAKQNAATSERPPLPDSVHKKLTELYDKQVREHIRGRY